MVYEFLPRQIKHTEVSHQCRGGAKIKMATGMILVTRHLPMAILRTCKAVDAEAKPIFTKLSQKFILESDPRLICQGHPSDDCFPCDPQLMDCLSVEVSCTLLFSGMYTNTIGIKVRLSLGHNQTQPQPCRNAAFHAVALSPVLHDRTVLRPVHQDRRLPPTILHCQTPHRLGYRPAQLHRHFLRSASDHWRQGVGSR